MLRGAFGLCFGRNVAAGHAPDLAGASNRDEREDEQAVAEVAEMISSEHRQREQAPEGGIAEALRIAAVGQAERREGREGEAREEIDEAERDHAPAPRFAIRCSRRRRRKPWITKAAIAVGIAHSEKCKGSIWYP